MSWSVAPYAPADQGGVIALISGIQRGEFGLDITPADQPDLLDIPGFYLRGAFGPGNFWVARDARGVVSGSIAVLNLGLGQGALRKMFVAREARGGGLAPALLATLSAWCAEAAIHRLFLGTTERFLAAHRFYEKHGFLRVERSGLPPRFPVMAVDSVFYAKAL